MMKYSQSAHSVCAISALLLLSLLLTACGGGSGSTGSNSPNVTTGCQSTPGTTSMCSGTPTGGNGGSSTTIDASNAAGVSNSVLGVIGTTFNVGEINGLSGPLITAVQSTKTPTNFSLVSFAMQELMLLAQQQDLSIFSSPQVVALDSSGQLNIKCENAGTITQQFDASGLVVDFDNCLYMGATYSGQQGQPGRLTISGINDANNVFPAPSGSWDINVLFSFTGLNINIVTSQTSILLSGTMRFTSASTDNGATSTGSIVINSANGGNLGITINGTANTLANFIMGYTIDNSGNTLNINPNSTISGGPQGGNYILKTNNPLVSNPLVGTGEGPYSQGELEISTDDGSNVVISILTGTSVQLIVNGGAATPMSWTNLLSATL